AAPGPGRADGRHSPAAGGGGHGPPGGAAGAPVGVGVMACGTPGGPCGDGRAPAADRTGRVTGSNQEVVSPGADPGEASGPARPGAALFSSGSRSSDLLRNRLMTMTAVRRRP